MEASHVCSACSQPATHLCTCKSSPLYLCRAHLTDHLDADGVHISRKVPASGIATGEVCSVCVESPATELCCCRFPPPLFCTLHRLAHTSADTGNLHEFFPISQRHKLRTSESLATVRRKLFALQLAKDQMQRNFERVERCEAAVQARFLAIVKEFSEVRDEHMSKLATLKAEMRKSLQEAERTIKANLLSTELSAGRKVENLLLSFSEDPSALELFRFEEQAINPKLRLSFGVQWESRFDTNSHEVDPDWHEVGNPKLAILHSNNLCVYECESDTWVQRPLNTEIVISKESAQTFIPGEYILTSGASISSVSRSEAYQIHINTGVVTKLAPMVLARRYHSLYYFHGFVFAFGGYLQAPLNQCEKYSLRENKWKRIDDALYTRYAFNVCEHRGLVYLIGGYSIKSESFDPVLEKFSYLPLDIPDNTHTYPWVCGTHIVVFTRWKIYTVHANSLRVTSTVEHKECNLFVVSRPVFYRQELLVAAPSLFEGISRINIETGEIKAGIPLK